jgi:hypothetical protein
VTIKDPSPSPLDWVTFASAVSLYLGLVLFWLLRRRNAEGAALAVIALLVGIGGFFIRSSITEVSLRGTVRSAAALAILVVIVTLGRPHLILDRIPGGRRMTREERIRYQKDRRRTGYAQLLFVAAIIVFLLVYNLTGSTFFN